MARPWWRDAVIYQIYTRSFFDTDGDGVGDLAGVRAKLPYLANLGVDVLWLSPLHPSPNVDYGYDVTDYFAVAPEFGTLCEFDALLAEARAHEIRIMMDLVMDYTSSAHPWFVQARSSRSSPYHDWYIWREGTPDRPPNNWPAFFSCGSAWTWNVATREWYLHYFTPEQPELNWANPEVRRAMHGVMRFWLDRGVGGFRLDVISFLSEPEDLADLPDTAKKAAGRAYANGPRLHEYLREIRAEVLERYDAVALGEGFGLTTDEALEFVAPSRRELDLLFLFEVSALTFAEDGDRVHPSLPEIKRVLSRWDSTLVPAGAWPTLFFGNHDVARMVTRFGDDGTHWRESATLLATLQFTLRGTPVVFQGDEIGMTNCPFDGIEEYRDVAAFNGWLREVEAGHDPAPFLLRQQRAGRDNARTPMQWSGDSNAGFTPGRPWIKVNPNARRINVAAQTDDPASVLSHYRRMIALRKSDPVLREGDLVVHDVDHPAVFAYDRRLGPERRLILLNLSGEPVEYDLAAKLGGAHATPIAHNLDTPPPLSGSSVRLRPWEAVVATVGTAG
jgi:oligo-1,6-glucosidase